MTRSKFSRTGESLRTMFPEFRNTYTYISTAMTIHGDVDAEQNLVIDGKMFGNISSNKRVSLGTTACFEGTIVCQSAMISGNIKGCIKASESITVKTPAIIFGDLISASVKVEPGVVIHGKIISDPKKTSKQTSGVQLKPEPVMP